MNDQTTIPTNVPLSSEPATGDTAKVDGSVIVSLSAAAELDVWFQRHIPNSAISRDTRLYNTVFNAVASIKSALAALKE